MDATIAIEETSCIAQSTTATLGRFNFQRKSESATFVKKVTILSLKRGRESKHCE